MMTDRRRVHVLKTEPRHWKAIASGAKTFEVRYDDRGYAEGDLLYLRWWDPTSRRWCGESPDVCSWNTHQHEKDDVVAEIIYILNGGQYGIDQGWVVLGFDVKMAP